MDHGAHDHDPLDDYPDFIFPCAKAVAKEDDSRGIILGGLAREKQWQQIELKVFARRYFIMVLKKL